VAISRLVAKQDYRHRSAVELFLHLLCDVTLVLAVDGITQVATDKLKIDILVPAKKIEPLSLSWSSW